MAVHPLVLAQVTTGRIVGVVTDPSGSRVPEVAVTVTEVETSTSSAVTTDSDGTYSATNLKIGTYRISFKKTGFEQSVQSNVELDIGQVVRVDVALKVGGVTETLDDGKSLLVHHSPPTRSRRAFSSSSA